MRTNRRKNTKVRNIAVALTAVVGAAAVLTVALAQGTGGPVNAQVNGHLRLAQNQSDVDIQVNATGLLSNKNFTLRAYTSGVTDCGAGPALVAINATSAPNGHLMITGTIIDAFVDDVGSVSIRSQGPPDDNPPAICWQDTTP